MNDLLNIFIRDRIPDVLFFVLDGKGSSISNLSKKTSITYSHMTKLIKKFNLGGLISTEKIGRERIIILTKKGKRARDLFKEIYGLVAPR